MNDRISTGVKVIDALAEKDYPFVSPVVGHEQESIKIF